MYMQRIAVPGAPTANAAVEADCELREQWGDEGSAKLSLSEAAGIVRLVVAVLSVSRLVNLLAQALAGE